MAVTAVDGDSGYDPAGYDFSDVLDFRDGYGFLLVEADSETRSDAETKRSSLSSFLCRRKSKRISSITESLKPLTGNLKAFSTRKMVKCCFPLSSGN